MNAAEARTITDAALKKAECDLHPFLDKTHESIRAAAERGFSYLEFNIESSGASGPQIEMITQELANQGYRLERRRSGTTLIRW